MAEEWKDFLVKYCRARPGDGGRAGGVREGGGVGLSTGRNRILSRLEFYYLIN